MTTKLKSSYLIALALMGFTFLYSCNKINKEPIKDDSLIPIKQTRAVEFTYGEEIKMIDLTKNQDDLEEEKIKIATVHLTRAMLVLMDNSNQQHDLVTSLMAVPSRTIDLIEYSENHPYITTYINQYLTSNVDNFATMYNSDWKTYFQINFRHQNEQTRPFVHLGNSTEINTSLQPYYCAAATIDEDRFPEFNDIIPAWYKPSTKEKFSGLSEEETFLLTNPIFIFDNGNHIPDHFIPNHMPTIYEEGKKIRALNDKLTQTEFKINFAFEGASKVDYNVMGIISAPFNSTLAANKLLAAPLFMDCQERIKKNKVGTTVPCIMDILDANCNSLKFTDFNGNVFRYNPDNMIPSTIGVISYERDWYASFKVLDNARIKVFPNGTIAGQTDFATEVRMSNSTDFYHFESSSTFNYPVVINHPTNNSVFTSTHFTRGFITIKRTF
jgi:hypothetical protein